MHSLSLLPTFSALECLLIHVARVIFRARNRWLKNKPNLRHHADDVAINELKKGRKTFITQSDQQLGVDSASLFTDSTLTYGSERHTDILTPRTHKSHRRATYPQVTNSTKSSSNTPHPLM